MAEMKKNAKIGIIRKITRLFGYVLPILLIIIFTSTWAIVYLYYAKWNEVSQKEAEYADLQSKLAKYKTKKQELISYWAMKWEYDAYINNELNYELIFNTIEKYIPSNSNRSALKITSKWNDVKVSVNTEIRGYQDYMSYLRVIDKCSFSSKKEKAALLNIQKIQLSKSPDGTEKLWEVAALNVNFNFNKTENPYLKLKKYTKDLKWFQDIWKFLYFINISKNEQENPDKEISDYTTTLKKFYDKKKNFTNKIAQILKTDENWYYIVNTWENFITKIRTENKLITLLETYYSDYKQSLISDKAKIFDDWDIIFTNQNTWKSEVVLNLKEKIDDYIIEINKELLKLQIMKNYNDYLRKDNYLSTFEKIKSNTTKKYTLKIDWKTQEISASEYITYIINSYNILKEDDPLIEDSINKQVRTEKNWKSIFTDISDKELKKKKKELYTQLIKFTDNIEKEKITYLNANTYLNSFYENEIKYNLYNEWITILETFFNKTNLDTKFLEGIKYSFFNFKITNNIATYKKQFIVTIENNKKLALKLNNINSLKKFITELNNMEWFIEKTTDIILASHNNIDCIYKDIKMETKDIYNGILKDRQKEDENKTKVKETDILIKNISNKIQKKQIQKK